MIVGGCVELRTPKNIGIEQDDRGELAHERVTHGRFTRAACAGDDQEWQLDEAVFVATLGANSERAAGVNPLVGPIQATLQANVYHSEP